MPDDTNNDQSHLSFVLNDMKIEISGLSSKFDGRDLHTAAVIGLIEMAPTEFWEKDLIEQGVDFEITPAEQFYASILSAIARHYAVDAMLLHDMEVYTVLMQLIGELANKGRL